MQKRIEWIDIAKCICILCVICSHLETNTSILSAFYNPFFLMTFFFCSGYCYKHVRSFTEHLYRKFRQLFVPWLFFSYANIFLSKVISFKEHTGFKEEIIRNLLQVRGYDDKLWFLASLFISFIPFYFIIEYYLKKPNNNKKLFAILLIVYIVRDFAEVLFDFSFMPWKSISLPWHIDYIPQSVFYMYIGFVYKDKLEQKLDKYNNYFIVTLTTVVYLILIYVMDINNQYILVPFKILRHIISIYLVILISKKINTNKYLSFVGKNTLLYFCMHNKISTLCEVAISRICPILYSDIINKQVLSSLFAIFLTMIISFLLIIPTKLVNKYCPYILGKEKKYEKI